MRCPGFSTSDFRRPPPCMGATQAEGWPSRLPLCNETAACPLPCLLCALEVVAWLAEEPLVRCVVATTCPQRHLVVDCRTQDGDALGLACLAQATVALSDGVAVSHPCAAPLALYRCGRCWSYAGERGCPEPWRQGAQLHALALRLGLPLACGTMAASSWMGVNGRPYPLVRRIANTCSHSAR